MATSPHSRTGVDSKVKRNLRHLQLLERQSRHVLNYLERQFGIECEVYYPEKVDTTYQEADESIPVNAKPSYKGVLIIPQVYQRGGKGTSDMLDMFDDEPALYLPHSLDFPRNSIIKPLLDDFGAVNRNILYRIDRYTVMSPRAWYRKALLVPAGRRKDVPLEQDIEILDVPSQTPTKIQQSIGHSFNPQVNKGFRKVRASE